MEQLDQRQPTPPNQRQPSLWGESPGGGQKKFLLKSFVLFFCFFALLASRPHPQTTALLSSQAEETIVAQQLLQNCGPSRLVDLIQPNAQWKDCTKISDLQQANEKPPFQQFLMSHS